MGQLRIIAGKWRGRKINFPDENGVRPTLDRIRETVFNWLQMDIEGATCLDCFAGSGAFGMEALSRGAKHVTFIDQSHDLTCAIKNNLSKFNCQDYSTACAVLPAGFSQFASKQFDIVFIDPPYSKELLAPCLESLVKNNLVHKQTLVYLETNKRQSITLPPEWELIKQKTTSSIWFSLATQE